jgi:hypothetical protein
MQLAALVVPLGAGMQRGDEADRGQGAPGARFDHARGRIEVRLVRLHDRRGLLH